MQKYLEIAYKFYPRNISSIEDKENYHNSMEHSRLIKQLNDSGDLYGDNQILKLKLNLENEIGAQFEDHTLPTWMDRCFNWQVVVGNKLIDDRTFVLCINISKVIPEYFAYILEVEYDESLNKLKYLPRRNYKLEKTKFKAYINKVEKVLASDFPNVSSFPQQLLDVKVEDINFQDIEMGNFTFFNAFFLNHYTTKFA